MIRINQMRFKINVRDKSDVDFDINKYSEKIKSKASNILNISPDKIFDVIVRKHSIDARKTPTVFHVLSIDLIIDPKTEKKIIKNIDFAKYSRDVYVSRFAEYKFPVIGKFNKDELNDFKRPVIIGFGPAGIFAAYELAKIGLKPIVFERGSEVRGRRMDVDLLWNDLRLNVNSNIQFGEGGAGCFSDGKLYTGISDKASRIDEVFDVFVKYGAPHDIKYENHPHIGSDVLPEVIKNIRTNIINMGGEIKFNHEFISVLSKNGRVSGAIIKNLSNNEAFEIETDKLILAIGHSARDTFRGLYNDNIKIEPKDFAIRVRVIHPQKLVNSWSYGPFIGEEFPSAPYKLTTHTNDKRGVYSFCMCPGGYVVNASSSDNMLCVNGMSNRKRDNAYANSAIVTQVRVDDFYDGSNPLSGMDLQIEIEKKCFELCDGKIPVQFYCDFKNNTEEHTIHSDIEPGNALCGLWDFGNIKNILPDYIANSIIEGMESFGKKRIGFNDDNVIFAGVETRTSSPIRIVRDFDMQSVSLRGLYPIGEGAGYAGGITSSAVDGIRVSEFIAEAVLKNYKSNLRKRLMHVRDAFDINEREHWQKKIEDEILSSREYKNSGILISYVSFKSEFDTKKIIEDALKNNKDVYVPRVIDLNNSDMEFYKISNLNELEKGCMGIMEPKGNTDKLVLNKKSRAYFVLPCVGCDENGVRIGYGGGFYDKYLNKIRDVLNENNSIKLKMPTFPVQIVKGEMPASINDFILI